MRWVWLGVGPLLVFTGCVQILGGDNDYRAGEGGGAGSAGMGGSGGGSGSGSASGSGGGGGTGGGSSSASGSGGAGGGGTTCLTGSTPMVLVQGPQGPYCIDATEVTSLQYSLWLETLPVPNSQDPVCGWKTTYVPRSNGGNCNATHYDPILKSDYPVVCIDWCDARAFCEGVGKRLCGGFGGQAVDYDSFNDYQKSEWTFACSAGGQRTFPYGDTFEAARCVDDHFDGTLNAGNGNCVAVGTASTCEGGVPGLFDMSGNAWEWEDACKTDGDAADPRDDRCRDRGGSMWDLENYQSCTSPSVDRRRDNYNKHIGFRCCADPIP
ncbi:formylglycine-generating enzyme family protein [Polyangium spumosum]|uniref:SUMF1/EgtB/PvdO family nonheme iron enzyme n=1 Tax=Polyangium spumosum TaxID=889282 RepID=A0A6N7PSA4_9BACT|nr:SUMF1/EgtB/PvdO family nonheme iron enzyme [Polyangium spumosum]MRG93115.1 SUMF1/EgtB/PvdO family nonheme iron enzyme [Polyangium spumosum]